MTYLLKYDEGKPCFDLIPVHPLTDLARVFAFGADKYSRFGWRDNAGEWSRFYAAALRHLTAWYAGEWADPESGLPHLAHATACLMILASYEGEGIGEDDRPVVTWAE